jgi:hypothetical protein
VSARPALRLACVADIHHGPDEGSKQGRAALPLLRRFLEFVEEVRPDAVLELGDRIFLRDWASDRELLAEVAAPFRRLEVPRAHVLGNHDLWRLDREDNAALLGAPAESHVLTLGGWDLVVWQADPGGYWGPATAAREEDLAWLEAALAAAPGRPCVVASHFALVPHGLAGNPYFTGREAHAAFTQHERIREMLAASGRVAACVCGHLHQNCWAVDRGIPHLAVQSLTETWTTGGEPAAAWGLLELERDLRWRVWGRDPLDLALPLAPRPGPPACAHG